MSDTIRFFRDTLSIDQTLLSKLSPHTGDTLVLAGRQVSLSTLLPAYNYVIAADQLTVVPQAATSLTGVDGNPSPSVTVLALAINGSLAITCAGMPGRNGNNGADGESGIENSGPGRPIILPGENGGNGEDGGTGGNGGTITIHFSSAGPVPTGNAPAGIGGKAGKGGKGGAGRPPGKKGKDGRSGRSGAAGKIDIAQVAASDVWKPLDAASAQAWAAYRAEVAGFLFRKFDPGSQLAAFQEAGAALVVNPADPDAAAIRSRIANRQTPSGLARDLDIAPDFPALAANLTAEIAVVQGAFQTYLSVVSLETIAEAIRDNLSSMALQLSDRKLEAQADIAIAQQDVRIAQTEKANIQVEIDAVQKQIDEIRENSFSIVGILSDVGSIAGVIVGIASGVGAIISIPAGLAALQRVAEGRDLVELLKKLDEKAKDPNHKTQTEGDIEEIKQLGGGMKDLIQGTKSMISFGKVLADLEGAMGSAGQSETGKLLKQQAALVRQKMVAQLRENQANLRVAAARLRVSNLDSEILDIQQKLSHWNADAAILNAATDTLIRAARQVLDMVMEDVFLAQRAREIYELDEIPGLRFDFGFIHPDQDHSLSPAARAAATLTSLSGFSIQVLAWNQIFQQLNTAEIGFDVIHPQLSVAITDTAQLRGFAGGARLDFSIALTDLPERMFELKVNALSLELKGASSPQSTNIWMTHSGDWSMIRRSDGSLTSLHLLPRSEVFACSPSPSRLAATIPAHPQSSAETGPPFSFWGRGVASTFRLQIAPPSAADMSSLSAVNLTIDCIAYAPQGSGALIGTRNLRPNVRVVQAPRVRTAGGPG